MLLRFESANFLSFKDRQELILTSSPLKDTEAGLLDCTASPTGKALPAVVIYGANASGKSNFVAALGFMRSSVLLSHSRGDPEGGVPRKYFALDSKSAQVPSTFALDFALGEARYHYGFEATDDAFTSEWLYAYPKGKRQILFEREKQNFKFGRALRGRNKVISELTRANSLFLSAAIQNDHKQLSKVADFFRSLNSEAEVAIAGHTASLRLSKGELDVRTIKFLESLGTGVIDFQIEETSSSDESVEFQRAVESVLQKFVDESLSLGSGDKDVAIKLAHRVRGGDPIFFDLDQESAGTRRLLVLLDMMYRALEEGSPLIVDELDASLHTQACEAILALFSSDITNPNGAQLIATTHDTNLLQSKLLRRDQVWFAEKDPFGATRLYPLSDIRTRKGDNIEKGYLQGRYGAIPFTGSVSQLLKSA